MNTESLIRAPYVISANQSEPTGAVCWWRLSGNTDLGALFLAWSAAGLDTEKLPLPPAASLALRRAMEAVATGQRELVRPLGPRGEFAIMRETVSTSAFTDLTPPVYEEVCRGRASGTAAAVMPRGEIASKVRRAFDEQRNTVTATDTSNWLTGLMRTVDAVPLRDTGGLYFVPKQSLPAWNVMAGAIQEASDHKIYGIPAMPVDDTLEAVLEAVTNDADRITALIEASVLGDELPATARGKGQRVRGLRSRMREAEELEDKLAKYAAILGKYPDAIQARISSVKAHISLAILGGK